MNSNQRPQANTSRTQGNAQRPQGSTQKRRPVSQKKAKFPLFWVCLVILVEVAIIVFFSMRSNMVAFLEEYESVQPKYVETEIFDMYFKEMDFQKIAASGYLEEDEQSLKLTEFETDEDLIQYLSSLTAGKEISGYSISSGVEDGTTIEMSISALGEYFVDQFNSKGEIKYIVKADEDKVAEFTLGHSDDPTQWSESGFKKYVLTGIKLYGYPHESVTVRIPDTSKFYLNGIEVSEKYIVETEKSPVESYMIEGAHAPGYVTYHIGELYLEPEIKVVDRDGEVSTLEYDEEKNMYSSSIKYSEELKAEHAQRVITAIENYAKDMQSDGHESYYSQYYDQTSDLWKSIITTENYFVIDHNSWSFEDQEASEFYAYSENVFSCRVKMTHKLHRWGMEDYVDYIEKTLFLRKCDDGVFRIYAEMTH